MASVDMILQDGISHYTQHNGLNLANQKGRKLRVFDRKLEGSHSLFRCYFDKNETITFK